MSDVYEVAQDAGGGVSILLLLVAIVVKGCKMSRDSECRSSTRVGGLPCICKIQWSKHVENLSRRMSTSMGMRRCGSPRGSDESSSSDIDLIDIVTKS